MSVQKFKNSKVYHERKPYSMILNDVLQKVPDQGTLATYCYLCSLPPEWKVNREQLMKRFGIGKDKLKKQLSWLNENNLIEYIKYRKNDGTIESVDILVKDGNKFFEKNHKDTDLSTKKQSTGGQIHPLDNPPGGKSALYKINNIYKENKKIKNENIAFRSSKDKSKRPDLKYWEPGHPDYDRNYGNK